MTRDKQIAQLKLGDSVGVRGIGIRRVIAVVPPGHVFVAREHELGASAYSPALVNVELLEFPEPPSKPKAVPGVRYASKCGSCNVQRMGTQDGRLWNPELYLPTVDLDSSWTHIDPVEEGK